MVYTHTCKNGVRIAAEQVNTVRSVTIGIWVLTGSRNEHKDLNGISHFIEHMFFKGTKKRNAKEIVEAFDSIGGQVNAFTSKEYTCFYARVLDTYKEKALEILTDMFFDSVFSEDEIEREKKVVMEEIKMYEDTPDDRVHDLLSEAAFHHHALARPILGVDETLQTFTRESLITHIDNHYTPGNVVISIAGNFSDDFIHLTEKYFDRFNNSDMPVKRFKPDFSADTITQSKETNQAHLCIGYESIPITSDRIPVLLVMNNILGGGMSSRLFQEIREKHGLAYSVFSYSNAYLDSGLLVLYAGTTNEQLPLLETKIDETINILKHDGITEKELTNSKAQLKGNMMLRLEGTSSRMTRNGRNELLLGKHQTLDEASAEIDKVTPDMVHEMIKETFKDERAKALISRLEQ